MKKSLSKMMKEVDLAKASLEKAKQFEQSCKNDKALKEYDAAIKKYASILKTNEEEAIKLQLQQAYLGKGDLLKKSGFTTEANKCYQEAVKTGSVEAQERLRGTSSTPATLTPPPISNANTVSPVLPPQVSPLPSSFGSSSGSSQAATSSPTLFMGSKGTRAPATPNRSSTNTNSTSAVASASPGIAQSQVSNTRTLGTPSVAKVAEIQSLAPTKTPAAVPKSSAVQPASSGSITNTGAVQSLVIFKNNPTAVQINFKFGADVKVESTAHLAWLMSKESRKETQHYQKWLGLALDVINLFSMQPVKQRPEITEILALANIENDNISTELLEVFIDPIKKGTLLKPSMLNGLADIINQVNPALLDADDFIQILRVLKDRLQTTHSQGSAKKLEHLLRSVSRLMTAMVDAGIKGLARKEDHQPLYDALKGYKSHQNRRISFDTYLAMQALSRLPNDESNLGSFLRRFYHVAKGVAHVSVAVLSISPDHMFDALTEFYKAAKFQLTFQDKCYIDIRYAQFLMKWDHFLAFEEFIRDQKLNRSEDLYLGVIYALKEVLDIHRDEQTQISALEYIYGIFNDVQITKFENVKVEIINVLVDVVRQGDPILAGLARKHLNVLLQNAKGKDADLIRLHMPDLATINSRAQKLHKPVRNLLLTSVLDHSNATLADKLDKLDGMITKGLELDLPSAVEKKCEMLRARVLSDQDIKDELATYIPIRGAYRITDTESFDMEEKAREFIKGQRRKLLLIGNAGGGKSTFNRYLLTRLWEEYQPNGIIPIFVSLPIMTNPVNDLMKEALTEAGFTAKEMEYLKENRELCIILDGYDEVNLTENLYSTNKLSDWKKISIILSCRTQYLINFKNYTSFFLPSSGDKVRHDLFQEVTVVPFSDAQIEAYIRKYLQLHSNAQWKSAEEWVAHIKSIPGLRELIETPFLLMLAMDVLPDLVERYSNLTGAERVKMLQASLYDAFVENWFQREENKLIVKGQLPNDGHDIKEDFWEFGKALASEMHSRKQYQVYYAPTRSLFGNMRTSGKSSPWAMFFSNDDPGVVAARKACLLKKVGPQQWAFFHATFVDYFATKAMYDETMGDEFEEDMGNSGIIHK